MNERIAVLCGGDGAEREVSLRSGAAVTAALAEAGYRAEAVDLHTLEEARHSLRGFDAAFVAMHGSWGEDGRLEAQLEAMGLPYTGSDPRARRTSRPGGLSWVTPSSSSPAPAAAPWGSRSCGTSRRTP